jgi:hypothetical protein
MTKDVEYKCKEVQVSVDGTFKVPSDAVILGVYIHKIATPAPPEEMKKGATSQAIRLVEIKVIHYAVPVPFSPSIPLRHQIKEK